MKTKDQSLKYQGLIFIILLFICWFFLSIGAFFFWRLTRLGLQQIHNILPNAVGFILALGSLFIFVGIVLFTKTIFLGSDVWYSQYMHRLITRYLFPLMIIFGRIFKIPEERIQISFIDINNRLVQIKDLLVKPNRIMILLPQCLQNNDCTTRITKDIRVCKRCGRCQIAGIISILDKYNILCWVATGGTLARKYISDYHPDAIIAIACARDLSSGIIDCFPIPVYAILNERPEGPCVNTFVDMRKINWAVENLILK